MKTVFSPVVQYTCVVINLEKNSIFLNPAIFLRYFHHKQYIILQKKYNLASLQDTLATKKFVFVVFGVLSECRL